MHEGSAMRKREGGARAPARGQTRAATAGERAAMVRYGNRWRELRAQGVEPVLVSPLSPTWQAWRAYYRSKGLILHLQLMDREGEARVPCELPADFEGIDVKPDPRQQD